jgi:hypothetical protein
MAKAFISYKRGTVPDVDVMTLVRDCLEGTGHEVFVDDRIAVGENWPAVIEREIGTADVLIVLLSAVSVTSEMVIEEVAMARRLHQKNGKPRILPVRIRYSSALPYDLGAWLDRVQHAKWDDMGDSDRLCADLTDAIAGAGAPAAAVPDSLPAALSADGAATEHPDVASAPLPAFDPRCLGQLETPGGAVRLSSPFYIERDFENQIRQLLSASGVTLNIQGGRQTGKTSLLARLVQQARDRHQPVVYLDFQRFDNNVLSTLDSLLRYLAEVVATQLRTRQTPDLSWNSPLGPKDKLTQFFERELLDGGASVLMLLDEVDRLFAFPYRDDFFGLIRSWHNNRAFDQRWERFSIVLALATEATQLITDQNQSPFNVGYGFETRDFNREEVIELNVRHGSPVARDEVDEFMSLLHGHPLLVRKALYEGVMRGWPFRRIVDTACDDDGPFGDHLQRLLLWLTRNNDLRNEMMLVLREGRCSDDVAFYRLRAAGLIIGHSRGKASPRCGLYARYLGARL